ncbi:MAG: chloride channel protein, partial [Desulfatibacillaceae bacterium]|nr:chloride channel protein [Desulfatibacillaceae bacterium]
FVQQALFNESTILFLLLLAGGKILTTSFSIGSGGSGGVFGPSIVIGGALGGAVGLTFAALLPNVVTQPGAFVVVGMAGFFTGVSNAPISTIIFVSEMTGSYHLLLPSLLVCSVSYLFSRRWTIFAKQPKNRMASPAHAGDFFVDILQAARVRDLMDRVKKYPLINEQMPFGEFKNLFVRTSQHYFPVVDEKGRFSGIFSSTDIRRVLFEKDMEALVLVRDIATRDIIFVTPHDDLAAVMQKFTVKNLDMLPVVRADDFGILIGMLSRRDVIAHYNSLVAGFSRDKNQNSANI